MLHCSPDRSSSSIHGLTTRHAAALLGKYPGCRRLQPETNLPFAIAEARGTGATAVKIYADLTGPLVKSVVAEAHRQHLLVWSHAAVFPALPADIADAGVDVMSHACMLGYQLSDPPHLTYEDKTPVDAAKVLKPNPTMVALYRTMKQRGIILDATLFPYESHPGPLHRGDQCSSRS